MIFTTIENKLATNVLHNVHSKNELLQKCLFVAEERRMEINERALPKHTLMIN